MTKMRALVQGNAPLGIDPPVQTLAASIQAIGSAAINGDIDLDVPPFRIGCVAGSISDAASALGSIGTDGAAMISAQVDLVGVIGIGG